MDTVRINNKRIIYYKINNRVKGKPRYVVHYKDIANSYYEALSIVSKIGGEEYPAKWLNGAIVITTHNLERSLRKIL